jgi:4-amino-4-deoxy-L-arabinose transferase-like glycosyltransferase
VPYLFVIACWILPALGLYSLFYFQKPTYLLILLPPILIIFTVSIFYLFRFKQIAYSWFCILFVVVAQLGIFYGATESWPGPIYRISYAYFKQQDAAWAKLRTVIASANDEKNLLLWINHPTLPFYAIRIIPWAGKVVYLDNYLVNDMNSKGVDSLKAQRIDLNTMHWDEPKGHFVDPKQFKQVLTLDVYKGKMIFEKYDANLFSKNFHLSPMVQLNKEN